jgi:hypothetical protein
MDDTMCLLTLPKELLALIVSILDTNYYFHVALTCKALHIVVREVLNNKNIAMKTNVKNMVVSVSLFEWAREHNCPLNRAGDFAVKGGHLEVLKYMQEHRCWQFNKNDTCRLAAMGGHLEMLKYLYENHCRWGKMRSYYTSKGEYLKVMRAWPQQEYACWYSARLGNLEMMRYLHEHGCPWHERTCCSAAEKGHLDVLRYAHEHGCPWDEWTCSAAARKGYLEVLRYAHEHGCPWDEWTPT